MAKSDPAAAELQNKCGLPLKQCRAALAAHDGNVDAALAALIDAERINPENLDPDTVSDELFERAARQQKLSLYRKFATPKAGLVGMIGKLKPSEDPDGILTQLAQGLEQARSMIMGNKTPEQMLAEDEKHDAKRLEKFQKTTDMKRVKPMTPGRQARLMAQVKRRSAWLDAHPFTLRLKPFPPLKRNMHDWTGRDTLKAWEGTQERHGPYTSRSSRKPSKGTVLIDIPRLDENDADPRPPSPEQVAAYAYLKENQDAATEAIMAALLDDYTKLRKSWLKHNPDLDLPRIETTAHMRKNVGLGTLHMHDIAKKGFAYIGLELGCTWDEEHGAGVLIHRDRVIAVGQATSFDSHKAIEDGGRKLKWRS